MLKRSFDPSRAHRAVAYLRFSSDQQNPRSCEQQFDEINRRLKAAGYNWKIVKVYRDDAISGRFLRKRAGYQQMLEDLKTRRVAASLILVDMLERFGRAEGVADIRRTLFERHGILVVTADSNFTNPLSLAGQALGMVESIRATTDAHGKAHTVVRGKIDVAKLKHWPGGPPPFGFMLRSILKIVDGREVVDHCVLVPNPATRWIIELLFEQADIHSLGTTRLAKMLVADPRVTKKLTPGAIGYILDNTIYRGELRWAYNSTGIVDDVRVVERNPANDVLYVPDFCEAIVDRDRWLRVQAKREIRRKVYNQSHCVGTDGNEPRIAPVRGLALSYVLSGLLFCGSCGGRLTASSTGMYTSKAGERRRYVAYICPNHLSGRCDNAVRIPEPWIREAVIGTLRDRLFPGAIVG